MSNLKSIQEWDLIHSLKEGKTFFAGYYACLCANLRVGEPDISEEQAIKFFEERKKEAEQFYRDLMSEYVKGN